MVDIRRAVGVVAASSAFSFALLGCSSSTSDQATPSASSSSLPATTITAPSTTTTTTPAPPTTTTTVPLAPPLQQGDTGPDVAALQTRLTALGYWLADEAGTYGVTTAHAVTAFQKRADLERDGVAGPLTQAVLATAVRPLPQDPAGHHFEVDLASQTMLLVDNGAVQWVFDVSTGARAGTTPKGDFAVFRQVNGYDHGPLGTLYRPKYFKGGVAIHGFTSVPAHPASHGCVRVLNPAMDYLWETDALAVGTPVVVY